MRNLLVGIYIFLVVGIGFAQDSEQATVQPQAPGLGEVMRSHATAEDFSGSVLVARDGRILYQHAFGIRPCVFALDPSLDVSQYAHTAWKIREGFCKGEILSIA